MKHAWQIFVALGVTVLIPTAPAYAYLDAGSVSMAFQVAIGAVASAMMFGKFYFRKFMMLFSRTPADRSDNEGQAN